MKKPKCNNCYILKSVIDSIRYDSPMMQMSVWLPIYILDDTDEFKHHYIQVHPQDIQFIERRQSYGSIMRPPAKIEIVKIKQNIEYYILQSRLLDIK